MKLTIIGATGSMSGPRSAASCYLVQAPGKDPETGRDRIWSIVLEMGPGSFGSLWRHLPPRDVDALFLSHCHADHMGDIISMHVYRKWGPEGCLPALALYGPRAVRDRIRQIDGTTEPEMYEDEFDIHTLVAGEPVRVGPMTVTPVIGQHTVESFGLRIEGPRFIDEDGAGDASCAHGLIVGERTDAHAKSLQAGGNGATMFFTGDTDLVPTIVEGARGVDLLLTEVGFTTDDVTRGIHMDGVRAGELATAAGVGHLVATHIQPWVSHERVLEELRTTWSGPVDFADTDRSFIVG
ncbi:MBL fold metallo-hydrolase [Schaalia sp. ZJ405]|uniref:MBL fold metallo-hydrolase n=1 Tax=Schaalia sp. ZJ405 TaxID=2709403 RepID=UPI0013ED4B53|nr:MBL fold metallo-hydrolase [Schaalia sp. ZJ405]QPK80756.1 MBL fold metallo-hydrolase [Schaalia sp. ZJ405]